MTPVATATRSRATLLHVLASDRHAVAAGIVLWLACAASLVPFFPGRIQLMPDSVSYLDVAQNLHEGRGLVHRWAYWDPVYEHGQLPTPTSMWPPGLSLAIAGGMAFGLDAVTSGRAIVMFAVALLPVGLFAIARHLLPGRAAVLCALAATAVVPVFEAGIVATELPFLLLATLAVLASIEALAATRHATGLWLAASLAAGGAFLLRYVGIASVAAVPLCAIASSGFGRAPWRRRCLAASLPAGMIVAVIALKNWWVSQTPGQPWPGSDIFWHTLAPSLRSALHNVIGGTVLDGVLPRAIGLATLAALLLLAVWSYAMAGRRQSVPEGRNATRVLLLHASLCLAVTVLATAANGMNLEPRYVTIVASWVLLAVVAWALRGGSAQRLAPGGAALGTATLGSLVVWIVLQSVAIGTLAQRPPRSYVEAAAASPTTAWLRANTRPDEVLLTTRGAEVAQWLPNRVLRLPRRPHSARSVTEWRHVECLASAVGARFLVHSRGVGEDAKYNHAESLFLRTLDRPERYAGRVAALFPDAVVYWVSASDR